MIDLKTLPTSPGVYIYRNSAGEIIYVGKAINLKKRVTQYFQRDDALGPKTKTLVSQIDSIETKIVGSEIEALILEASLIKKHRPKYNSMLKDDRSYIYICITHENLPRVFSAHLANLPPKADIFGPFPSSTDVKNLLKITRRIFPYLSKNKHSSHQCLYCHLGLCPGPNPNPQKYRHTIGKIKKLLGGRIKFLIKNLTRNMKKASVSENYELALQLKNQIDSLNYIISGWKNLNNLFQDINLPEDNQSSAINELKNTLQLKTLNRLECYDISQMGTKYFVGSMTVWQNGHLATNEYRKFKISSKTTPDDQFMIKEVIWRRLRHPEWNFPDLIIVDGGKPQLTSALSVSDIPVIGLAKRFETIVVKNNNEFIEINLPKNSHALRLIQSLRDEAHRFANAYRRQLMKKNSIK